jgi:hypothetical protein
LKRSAPANAPLPEQPCFAQATWPSRLRQEGGQYGTINFTIHNFYAEWYDRRYNLARDDPRYFTVVLIVRKL